MVASTRRSARRFAQFLRRGPARTALGLRVGELSGAP